VLAVVWLGTAPALGQPPATAATGVVRGVVVDRADGTPIGDVSVRVQDEGAPVKTDAEGRFELTGVPSGHQTLYVSVVGFILVKRPIEVRPGEPLDLAIALSEGTGTYSETVTVAGERFREQEQSVPAQQTLGSGDIQNLRNLLTNDPMRAIQVLPGVSTGDDFRSEFVVRGSPFSRMTFTLDGVPTSFLLHTVQRVRDGGSIAMLNGDILDGITLLNGSYPQRYGDRLGAELDFHMREGSRDRAQLRFGVSGTDASMVAEGPLGRGKAGSWLVSARKSYLELLLKQIDDDDDFGFGFSDVQSKLVYDVAPAHRAELTIVAGRSRLDQESTVEQVNQVHDGRNSAVLVNGGWRFTLSPRVVLTQRLALGVNDYSNVNAAGGEQDRGSGRDLTWRADVAAIRSDSLTIEGGAQAQWQHRALTGRFFPDRAAAVTTEHYDDELAMASAYAQARWSPGARFTVTPGGRVDRSSAFDTTASPWLLADVKLGSSFTLRGGAGLHHQVPGFEETFGLRRGSALVPERAIHTDLGIEQTVGADARWQVTLYHRRERRVLRPPDSELRLIDGRLIFPSASDRWENRLDGYARGVEMLFQRRRSSGLSGWLSYSLGFNRYQDRATAESFDGDFDQRHTLNAYGLYRFSDRFNLAAKLRAGSNVPAVGYWEQQGDRYFVSDRRNELRLPRYARLDVRLSRAFNRRSSRITLFVEVLNVLDRENVRFTPPGVNARTGQAFGLFDSMIPRVPSAGVLVEF
jgi:hypothetical protein